MQIHNLSFLELSNEQLYQILQARSSIFVVEQQCAYLDIDGLDKHCQHLFFLDNEADVDSQLMAYCRIIPSSYVVNHAELSSTSSITEPVSIGRVLVTPKYRKQGLAKQLMQTAIAYCQKEYPKQAIKISAQTYLKDFYQSLGFVIAGEMYLEDGIEHVDMWRDSV